MTSVLHVLPHPGGGGERYVDALSALEGFSASRTFLASGLSFRRAVPHLPAGAVRANRRARAADLVHVHGEVAGLLLLPSLGRTPSVVTLHGLNLLRRARGRRYLLAARNLRAIAARADRVICVSQGEYDDVASVVPAAALDRVVVVRNGVEPPPLASADERAAIRAGLGVPPGALLALFVGALDEVKEPLIAVRAAVAAGPDVVLLVAGDGPLRDAVAAEGGDRVRVLGFRTDVARLNAAADVFLLPSRREGLSYALLDAMAAGVVPVVSDVPGNDEAVGGAGILVPPADVAGFAEALARLAADPAERGRLAAAALARVEREFRVETMLERTRRVYDDVLAG